MGGATRGGGECEIDSLPGGGTTVNMRFRAADSTPDTVVDEEQPATKPRDDVALIDQGMPWNQSSEHRSPRDQTARHAVVRIVELPA